MNRHFEDTKYYLKRAGKTAKAGVAEEVRPVEEKVRKATGQENEPEQGRVEEIRADLKELQATAEGETKAAIGKARKQLEEYRGKST